MKRLVVLAFSLTGNTSYVCRQVAEQLLAGAGVGAVEFVDLVAVYRGERALSDVIALVDASDVVCIGWLAWFGTEAPGVLRLLRETPATALSGKPAFLVCTGGAHPGNGFTRVRYVLHGKGCTVLDSLFVKAPENAVLLQQDQPAQQRWGSRNTERVAPFATRLAEALATFQDGAEPAPWRGRVPSLACDFRKSRLIGDWHVDHARCVRCGQCVKLCPAKCISTDIENYPVFDHAACMGCSRCYNCCPKNAILMRGLEHRAPYRFSPHVLAEGANSLSLPVMMWCGITGLVSLHRRAAGIIVSVLVALIAAVVVALL
eukprot:TRINITY_DN241_c0_g1_i1.p1 TRINITY_DN241_c0_g1~~TRINITY_DN241_c0_g1_i1.p1  ORF type:complete len:333 (-),score=83.20 TRINITY_DN241_c0_g1_i1:1457-2407(-)